METTPQTPAKRPAKPAVIGGLVGAAGLALSIFALTAAAGASSPALVAQETEPEAPVVVEVLDSEEYELPAEFAAAEACWNDVAAEFGLEFDNELDDTAYDAIDWDAIDAASETCNDLLPEDVQVELAEQDAEWEAYDTCVNDAFEAAGIDLTVELDGDIDELNIDDAFVSVFTGDEETFAAFGDGDATITITKVGDDIAVTSSGDVEVETLNIDDFAADLEIDLDELAPADPELDAALAGCDDELPEGFDFDEGFDAVEEETTDDK